MRFDSNRLRALVGSAAAALLLVPAAAAATPLRLDADGDGVVDSVLVHDGRLVVVSAAGVSSVRLHPARGTHARLDGGMRVPGVRGTLLLVRERTSRSGVTDAVYRLRDRRLERVRVGSAPDGLVTAMGAAGFVDFDCGTAPRTIVQITAEPRGSVWRETVLTYAMQPTGFVLARVERRTVGAAVAASRRCPVVRVG